MNSHVRLFQHDGGLKLTFHCQNEDGEPLDLTQWNVEFFLQDGDDPLNPGREFCSKLDSPAGIVEYEITPADTARVGIFQGRLRMSNGASRVQSVGPLVVEIVKE